MPRQMPSSGTPRPSACCTAVRHSGPSEAVAEKFGLEPERLVFGNGSDEIFALINQCYLEPGDVMVTGRPDRSMAATASVSSIGMRK